MPARLAKKSDEAHAGTLSQPLLSVRVTNVLHVAALTAEDLRLSTLRRQFPRIAGCGSGAVLELFDRLGPVQSQVPRAPFLFAASRLPGVTYATICELFESHLLLKTSNLRGTVHTSGRPAFTLLDAVATPPRLALTRRALGLDADTVQLLDAEVRRLCRDQWRPRAEIVEHARAWLSRRTGPGSTLRLAGTFPESVVWGNSGLIRRPKDHAWERRTDIFHRTAAAVVPELTAVGPETALSDLVRGHLAAYGPVTRRDLAFFFGVGLRQVDAAVAALGDEIVPATGPDSVSYLDLADPPGGSDDPGLRLLADFDGLLLGFEGANRLRFVDADGLSRIWARANGVFTPVVLHDGRLVATWRTVSERSKTRLEVSMLDPGRLPTELFAGPVAALEAALAVQIGDVTVRRRTEVSHDVP